MIGVEGDAPAKGKYINQWMRGNTRDGTRDSAETATKAPPDDPAQVDTEARIVEITRIYQGNLKKGMKYARNV